MARKYNTRFVPGPGFEARVLNEASGLNELGGQGGRRPRAEFSARNARDVVKLMEIGDYIVARAKELASEHPRSPRNTGGLRGAFLSGKGRGKKIVPRNRTIYPWRREGSKKNKLGPRYLASFKPPVAQMQGDRLELEFFNDAPTADMVEEGTGGEGQIIRAKNKALLRIPIKKGALDKWGKYSYRERMRRGKTRGIASGKKAYRAAAAREYRAVRNVDPYETIDRKRQRIRRSAEGYSITGDIKEPVWRQKQKYDRSKQMIANRQNRIIERRKIAAEARGRKYVDKIRNSRAARHQVRGFEKRFVEVDYKNKRVGVSKRGFKIKRERYIITKKGKQYLGTTKASRYRGYAIFLRAVDDAVRKYF